MINNRKMNAAKRIAFAANDINRKSLIEWSYYNQDILKEHELIATGPIANILQGTIGKPVTRLHDGIAAANQQLASMITDQQIDLLIFFWDPLQPLPYDNGVRALHDLALTHNIIIAGNQVTADFVLSSALMNKEHLVPVQPDFSYAGKARTFLQNNESRKAVLKLNSIN